jgi:RNA polymerase sigma-70 factor (ECF subfamily)
MPIPDAESQGAQPRDQDAKIVDVDFLEWLYTRYSRAVLRRATSLMGESEAGKDVMQEVFLRALGASAEFPQVTSPLAWLYRITTNVCLNRLRDANRHRAILGQFVSPEEPTGTPLGDEALTLSALLFDVPQNLQQIAIHYFVDEMSQQEISDLLEVPRRTISYRLERFLEAARAANDAE